MRVGRRGGGAWYHAVYGKDTAEDKAKALNTDLKRWWGAYAERKADDEDEVHANTLTYDKRTLPRMAPAPTFLPEAETGKK